MTGGTPHAAGPTAAHTGREAPSAGVRTPASTLALLLAAAALAAGIVLSLWPLANAATGAGTLAAPAWLYAAAGLTWVGGAAALGALWAGRRQRQALHAAHGELAALRQALDLCQWHTDARHRLQQWQAPVGIDAPPPPLTAGQPIAEVLTLPEGRLLDRLEAHGLVDETVQAADGSRWRLRAAPRLDRDGLFAGHSGTLRRLADTPAATARPHGQAACDALAGLLPGPAWLLLPDGERPRRVEPCNAAAERLGGPAGGDWQTLLATLPRGLAQAVQALAPGAGAVHDGWQIALADVQTPPGARLLLMLPRAAGESEADGDAAAFSYTVSHDLRAPVRVVEGFTRIVKEDYGRVLDRVGNDHLDRVLGAAARMNAMIDALLNLAQLSSQPLQRQPVNLAQLAGYVLDDLRRQQPQRRVDVHIAPDLQAIGDPTLLRLVLENLLGNAWKYTGRCERAEIGFERALHDGREAFVVRDNGAGFDMRFADRLFGVFQRLHSANDFPGTGVGLASVRRIVRRHGGDAWAESAPGEGARFWFTLRG